MQLMHHITCYYYRHIYVQPITGPVLRSYRTWRCVTGWSFL